jgi:hypothetical protein
MYGEHRLLVDEIHYIKAYGMSIMPFLSNGVVVFGKGIAGWLEGAGAPQFL